MKIIFSTRFLKDSKKLKKKFPTIDQDLLDLVNEIEKGKKIGDKLTNIDGLPIYKDRIQNSAVKKGKSGGFRVIYYLEINNIAYFITIYSKSDQQNIKSKEIISILKDEDFLG